MWLLRGIAPYLCTKIVYFHWLNFYVWPLTEVASFFCCPVYYKRSHSWTHRMNTLCALLLMLNANVLSHSINMVGPIQWTCNTVRKMKNLATCFLFRQSRSHIKCLTYIACRILKWCQTMLSLFLSIIANLHSNLIKSNILLNKVFISTINCELPQISSIWHGC